MRQAVSRTDRSHRDSHSSVATSSTTATVDILNTTTDTDINILLKATAVAVFNDTNSYAL